MTAPDPRLLDLFAAEADYWQKRHAGLVARVRASQEALGDYCWSDDIGEATTGAPPEPPLDTVFVEPDGNVMWTRRVDGWHCASAPCHHCPCGWGEVRLWLPQVFAETTRVLPEEVTA